MNKLNDDVDADTDDDDDDEVTQVNR